MIGRRGKFGLPIPPLDPRAETEKDRDARVAEVAAMTKTAFNLAKLHLGEVEARKLFIRTVARKRGKRTSIEVSEQLLIMYDAAIASGIYKASSVPRLLGQRLYKERKFAFGHSPDAIRKRLTRLLISRKKQRAAAAHFWNATSAAGSLQSLLADLSSTGLQQRTKPD